MSKGTFLQEKFKKNKPKTVRLRFAPAPTGKMHLGNIRTALENFLFSRKNSGTFVLRIEDTDPARNFDPQAKDIINLLKWLGLTFDEGPYFQSERTNIYQEKLNELKKQANPDQANPDQDNPGQKLIYRCFCTTEELEEKRQRQISLKKPPRYDRTCLKLSQEEIQKKLDAGTPFIWRFKIDHTKNISFYDIARGELTFDLANFSDFPITRQDGSFTFIFANVIDDWLMNITYILRGDDHLTNTVNQVALLHAFDAPTQYYWHLPILCNKDGKKLSKRDFGFSIDDLKDDGYLPQAIVNYLGIIGGSVKDEIMTLDELVKALPEHPSSTSHIKYDVEKLNWVNHKWIEKLTPQELAAACKPFLAKVYDLSGISDGILEKLVSLVQSDLVILKDVIPATKFYFEQPSIAENQDYPEQDYPEQDYPEADPNVLEIIKKHTDKIDNIDEFLKAVKESAREKNIAPSAALQTIRLLLIGSKKGPFLHGLLEILGKKESIKRLQI